ncbi:MAG: hypothetical protein MR936_16595 [Eubacterium sp.]|nr:hypothetical protein [Eubacterium sp.]
MKNKLISILLLTFITLPICSCGNQAASSTNTSQDTVSSMDTVVDTAAPTAVPMEEQLLAEYEGIRVSAVNWDAENNTLLIEAENTSSSDCIIQFTETSVNDFMIDPLFSLNVNSQTTANGESQFDTDAFRECNIDSASKIQLKACILDASSFETLYISQPVTIQTGQPQQEEIASLIDTSSAVSELDGIQVVSLGIEDDPDWGKLWKLYITNTSDEDVVLYAPDIILNNTTVDVTFSKLIGSGKKAVGTIIIMQDDLNLHQISDISSASTHLQIQEPETYTSRENTILLEYNK